MSKSYNSYPDADRFAHGAESLALGLACVAASAWNRANEVARADAEQAAVFNAASARLQAARLKLARAEAARDAVHREAALRERDAQRRDLLRRAALLARLAA